MEHAKKKTDASNMQIVCRLMLYFGIQVATRVAYGTALAKLGKNNPRVIGLDGDTKNSTFSIKLKVLEIVLLCRCRGSMVQYLQL